MSMVHSMVWFGVAGCKDEEVRREREDWGLWNGVGGMAVCRRKCLSKESSRCCRSVRVEESYVCSSGWYGSQAACGQCARECASGHNSTAWEGGMALRRYGCLTDQPP